MNLQTKVVQWKSQFFGSSWANYGQAKPGTFHLEARRAAPPSSGDLDFSSKTVLVHEKKRVKGVLTTRRVPLSPQLERILRDWLAQHPGGPVLFCQASEVERSKKKRVEPTPITRDEAHDHFQRTLAESKWKVLKGWHVLRHSFASNLAAKGIDQRIIDDFMGHQTDEQRRRYRHLFFPIQPAAGRHVCTVFDSAR